MPRSLHPGMGENNKIEKRIAVIERFIGKLSLHRVFARNIFGRTRQYEVLAKEGGFEDEKDGIYDVALIRRKGKYFVTVTHGWVREIKTGSGDALAYHEAENHFEEADPPTEPKTYTDKLVKHPIEVGQAVYITVQIDANGRVNAGEFAEVTNPVEIEIADDEEESIQYTPKVQDGSPNGSSGTLRFKLALLEEEGDDPPRLKMFLAGDHIHWGPPLPAILSALSAGTGIGIVFKEWDNANNCYRVRAITQKDPVEATEAPPAPAQAVQIHVVQEPNRIIISGNSKSRKIKYQIGSSSPVDIAIFDDGLETLGSTEGNEIIIPIPDAISGALFQWKVTKATDTTVDVRGGTLTSQTDFAQADVVGVAGLVVGATGYVILTVTRDSATRDITSSVISYFAGEIAGSDYNTQIIPLAKVTFAGAITEIEQRKFEELNIFEDLVVVNGEFKFADLLIASRGPYATS